MSASVTSGQINAGATFATQPTIAVDGYTKRSIIEDEFRMLFPEDAILQSMIVAGAMPQGKNELQKKGFIGKKRVTNRRFEVFVYNPIAIEFEAESLSSTTLTLVSTTGLIDKMCLLNTANMTTCRIDDITSTTVCEITSFGSTSFSVTDGDVLLALGPAYEEASVNPFIIQKDWDNIAHRLQIMRFPVTISNSRKQNEAWVGNEWGLYKKQNVMEGARRADLTLLFGNQASSGDTTSGGSNHATAFYTTDGVWQRAQYSKDFGGNMTEDDFYNGIPNAASNTIKSSSTLDMVGGKQVKQQLLSFGRDKVVVNDPTQKNEYAYMVETFGTSSFKFRFHEHDAFNRGSLVGSALLFNRDDMGYAYMANRDFKPKENIQEPSRDGQVDEIIGEIGMAFYDGGERITKLTGIV